MKTVREILFNKGYDIYYVSPFDTVFDALKIMANKRIGALLVMDENQIVGIVS